MKDRIQKKDKAEPLDNRLHSSQKNIGMLNFLAGSTRPDVAFAVHQCARFSAEPKKSHETAVKRIAKYLRGTSMRGLSFRPDKDRCLECFVDADFAGG